MPEFCLAQTSGRAREVSWSALIGFSFGTLERRYSRIMLSQPQNMKPYLRHEGYHCARVLSFARTVVISNKSPISLLSLSLYISLSLSLSLSIYIYIHVYTNNTANSKSNWCTRASARRERYPPPCPSPRGRAACAQLG